MKTMPKYIEANWLLERAVPHGWSTPLWVSNILIEDAPAADVRENVHAHWIKHEDRECWYCSHCEEDNAYAYFYGEYLDELELQDFFCPKCGAQMDERS